MHSRARHPYKTLRLNQHERSLSYATTNKYGWENYKISRLVVCCWFLAESTWGGCVPADSTRTRVFLSPSRCELSYPAALNYKTTKIYLTLSPLSPSLSPSPSCISFPLPSFLSPPPSPSPSSPSPSSVFNLSLIVGFESIYPPSHSSPPPILLNTPPSMKMPYIKWILPRSAAVRQVGRQSLRLP